MGATTPSRRSGRGTKPVTSTPTTTTVEDKDVNVTYGVQITKKIGEFEFIKVNAEITVPLTISEEDLARIDAKMVIIRDKITDRLATDLQEIDI